MDAEISLLVQLRPYFANIALTINGRIVEKGQNIFSLQSGKLWPQSVETVNILGSGWARYRGSDTLLLLLDSAMIHQEICGGCHSEGYRTTTSANICPRNIMVIE